MGKRTNRRRHDAPVFTLCWMYYSRAGTRTDEIGREFGLKRQVSGEMSELRKPLKKNDSNRFENGKIENFNQKI